VAVIQHLDPHYESQLCSILQTDTPLRVVDATHGQKVEPDQGMLRMDLVHVVRHKVLVEGRTQREAAADRRR
jgi:hypothetical protein